MKTRFHRARRMAFSNSGIAAGALHGERQIELRRVIVPENRAQSIPSRILSARSTIRGVATAGRVARMATAGSMSTRLNPAALARRCPRIACGSGHD